MTETHLVWTGTEFANLTLNFTIWQLFACTRIKMWSAWGYSYPSLMEDVKDCKLVKEGIRLAQCKPASEEKFKAWCWQMLNSNDKLDCNAMSDTEKLKIRLKMNNC